MDEKKQFCIKEEILGCIKTKSYGFYVGAVAWLLVVVALVLYPSVNIKVYNSIVVVCFIIGVVLFLVCSLLKKTSVLAPTIMMAMCLMALLAFCFSPDMEGYFSTIFFDGFSVGRIFTDVDFNVLFSILAMLFGFIISAVAMFMPQNKAANATGSREEER